MHKGYRSWHIEKEKLNNQEKDIPFFEEREIWWCSLGINIGQGQDGKNENFERPVLVLKKFNRYVLWVLPMSSTLKSGPYYFTIQSKDTQNSVLLSQLRLISSKRLLRKIYTVSSEEFSEVEDKLSSLIKRNPPKAGGNLGGRSPL